MLFMEHSICRVPHLAIVNVLTVLDHVLNPHTLDYFDKSAVLGDRFVAKDELRVHFQGIGLDFVHISCPISRFLLYRFTVCAWYTNTKFFSHLLLINFMIEIFPTSDDKFTCT